MQADQPTLSYRHLAKLFFITGSNAFGGWSTTVLLIKKALVPKFLSERDLNGIAASSPMLPGPNQVLIVAQVAYRLRGFKGAIICVASYVLPSTILTILFSVVYFRFSHGLDLSSYIIGLRAGISGIILANGYQIGRGYVRHRYWLWTLVIIAAASQWWLGPRVVLLLLVYGLAGQILSKWLRRTGSV